MLKTKLAGCIVLFAAVLASAPQFHAQTRRARQIVVSAHSFGPVKIGMTAAQAARALGVRVNRDGGYEGSECYYTSPRGGYKDVGFMMSGSRIVRIDINSRFYATDRGAKVGDSEARIKQLYRGRYKISQHKYVDTGHYIEIEQAGGKALLLFETDGKHVTTYRIGKPEQVGYVEGCS